MPSFESTKRQLSLLGLSTESLATSLVTELSKVLDQNERIGHGIKASQFSDKYDHGLLVATSKKLISVEIEDKGDINVEEFSYDQIGNLKFKMRRSVLGEPVTGDLAFNFTGSPVSFYCDGSALQLFVLFVLERFDGTSTSPSFNDQTASNVVHEGKKGNDKYIVQNVAVHRSQQIKGATALVRRQLDSCLLRAGFYGACTGRIEFR